MMSLFSRKQRPQQRVHPADQKGGKLASALMSKRDGILEKKVLENADRELYKFDSPEQELGMSDLVKNHEPGTRFMYAAITGKESEDIGAKQRRLISFKPRLRKKAIPIDSIPVIKLYKETEVFPLDQIIPGPKKGTHLGDYVRISDAVVLYGAVVSPNCHFTHVNVGVSDSRLLSQQLVKTFRATTNLESRGNLALPYCVPRAEADCLTLTVSRERAFLEEGRQWGAIQIEVTLEFSDFPIQVTNQPVTALNMITNSTLEEDKNNPDNIDISIMNQNRKDLAELYLSGDLADENDPIINKTSAVKYAKSSIAGVQKGKKLEPVTNDWNFLSQKRIGLTNQDQNSIEPSDEGSLKQEVSPMSSLAGSQIWNEPEVPMKSAMKRPSTPPPKTYVHGKDLNQKDDSPMQTKTPPGKKTARFQDNGDIERLTPF